MIHLHRPPLVAAALWSAVTDRLGTTCRCPGTCGRRHHVTTTGICEIPDRPGERIVIAPATPMPVHLAAVLHAAELTVWCPACWRAAQRQRPADIAADTGDQLFLF